MKRHAAWLAVLALGACANLDANAFVREGMVRIDPHPTEAGARRVTIIAPERIVIPTSAADPSTEPGRHTIIQELLGQGCTDIVEEARLPLAPTAFGLRRDQIVYRVRCT